MTHQRYAFILRIWAESDDSLDQSNWRGSLQNASSEPPRYFNSLPKLIALLTAATGWQDASQPPQYPTRSNS
jgi:hypothetical protein